MTAANTNRPGNMENVYENRKTLEFGKIVSYDDKFKTLILQLSDGKTRSMTWSTFKGAWRKKAHTDMEAAAEVVEETIEDQLKDEGFSNEEVEEITASVECGRTLDASIERTLEKREEKPKKKRGAQLEFDGRSQNICACAKEFGMSANTLYSWIYYKHMSVEEAFEKAIAKGAGKND